MSARLGSGHPVFKPTPPQQCGGLGAPERFDKARISAQYPAPMPYRKTMIEPPIVFTDGAGPTTTTLSTVEEVIEYVRRRPEQVGWRRLRDAAFIAAAIPSAENIQALRDLAGEAFGGL